VLNVLFHERIGGPQLRVLQVAKGLRNLGYETQVAIPRGDSRFAELLVKSGIPCHQLNLVRLRDTLNPLPQIRYAAMFWPNVLALRRVIRRHEVKIVHTNGLQHLQAAIAARIEKVPLVWHLNDVEGRTTAFSALPRLVKRWADSIGFASRAVASHCFPKDSGLSQQMRILYAPVDTERFSDRADPAKVRDEFHLTADCPVVGIVANYSPGKGIEYFLEAAGLIRRRHPDVKFLVVGEQLGNRRAYRDMLIQKTDHLGLRANVIFADRRTDMPEIYRAMTIFVQASEAEACPMAVLEASASAVAVVATDVGGTNELIESGHTGLLVECRNPQKIAEAVMFLLADASCRLRMGLAARKRMQEHFSLDHCVSAHAQVYQSLLDGTDATSQREKVQLGQNYSITWKN
jgi:glycosyltransferase involved in cell wall biosynthesis